MTTLKELDQYNLSELYSFCTAGNPIQTLDVCTPEVQLVRAWKYKRNEPFMDTLTRVCIEFTFIFTIRLSRWKRRQGLDPPPWRVSSPHVESPGDQGERRGKLNASEHWACPSSNRDACR